MVEFGVHEIRTADDDCIVIGRCYCGPLARGDVFTLVRPRAGTEQAKSVGARL